MRRTLINRSLLLAVVAITNGCGPKPAATNSEALAPAGVSTSDAANPDALVQFSLLAALASNDYAGGPPLRDLLSGGDFGVGTFNNLNGEMIVLDGRIYQALADGTVREADLGGTTPFAAVTFFEEDGRIGKLSAATLNDLDEQLDRKLPRPNSPYAIRIEGEFAELTVRSVPEQTPPFRPLVEVVKDQVTWPLENVRGTIVGLRCPNWMSEINVSGYHWHFLSDDHKIGGHLLACQFDDCVARFDECATVVIHIPKSREFDNFDASSVSDADIDKIERQRTN